jgi:hypothetical protein
MDLDKQNSPDKSPKRSIFSLKFWARFGLALLGGLAIGFAVVGLLVAGGLDGIAKKVFAFTPLVSIVCAWGYAREIKADKSADDSGSCNP